MAIGLSLLSIMQENDLVNRENEILRKEIEYLIKENAILEAENIKLRRYKDLYDQYVLWKEF